ncbi:MAG: carbon-nitrogen hydrolase family protein [Pseudomonadota bacterium]
MRTGLVQITASDDPAGNLATLTDQISEAVAEGAGFVLTPEVSNCLSTSRTHQREVLALEPDDTVLSGLRNEASRHGIWLLAGSLALKLPDEPRFANRSILIAPDGGIAARYDKIHMFDVAISDEETYRESDGYRPGRHAVLADAGFARIGLTICYDVRFPDLYRRLATAGADVLTVPSAFSPVSGAAHWHTLLRARAIETGCWVLAPAQTGDHPLRRGRPRSTYGHGLAVSPWGQVVLDMGVAPGVGMLDIDLGAVAEARRRIPALLHGRAISGPD